MITDAEWLRDFALLQRQTNLLARAILDIVKSPPGTAEANRKNAIQVALALCINVELLTGVLPIQDKVMRATVEKNAAVLMSRDFESEN